MQETKLLTGAGLKAFCSMSLNVGLNVLKSGEEIGQTVIFISETHNFLPIGTKDLNNVPVWLKNLQAVARVIDAIGFVYVETATMDFIRPQQGFGPGSPGIVAIGACCHDLQGNIGMCMSAFALERADNGAVIGRQGEVVDLSQYRHEVLATLPWMDPLITTIRIPATKTQIKAATKRLKTERSFNDKIVQAVLNPSHDQVVH